MRFNAGIPASDSRIAVRGLRVVATAAGRSTIAWSPPASNGGAPVLRYWCERPDQTPRLSPG